MNKFLEKDVAGNWNTIPPIPDDKIKNVNCHKFILYVMEKISWEEMISNPDAQEKSGLDFTFGAATRSISDTPFIFVKDEKSLLLLADRSCELGETYIGQVLDAQTGEMAHSFIVKRESNDKYKCFDKQGFKYPFSVYELGTILDFVNKDGEKSYQNQKWRFILLRPEEYPS